MSRLINKRYFVLYQTSWGFVYSERFRSLVKGEKCDFLKLHYGYSIYLDGEHVGSLGFTEIKELTVPANKLTTILYGK